MPTHGPMRLLAIYRERDTALRAAAAALWFPWFVDKVSTPLPSPTLKLLVLKTEPHGHSFHKSHIDTHPTLYYCRQTRSSHDPSQFIFRESNGYFPVLHTYKPCKNLKVELITRSTTYSAGS